jgi:hypothetical protein
MPDGVLALFANKADDTAPVPEGELAAQMALLLPFEARLLRRLAPALIRQAEAGARAWVAFPNDDAHMRAAVALNGLSQEFIAEHLERVALAFAAYTLRSLLPKGAGGAEEIKDDAGLFGRVPGFRALMRRWAQSHAAEMVADITRSTMEKLREAVDAALRDQQGQRPLARRIIEYINGIGNLTAKARANAIARTETHNAATYGSDEAAKGSGFSTRASGSVPVIRGCAPTMPPPTGSGAGRMSPSRSAAPRWCARELGRRRRS